MERESLVLGGRDVFDIRGERAFLGFSGSSAAVLLLLSGGMRMWEGHVLVVNNVLVV